MKNHSEVHEVEIKKLITEGWDGFDKEAKAKLGDLEVKYIIWRRRAKYALFGYFFIIFTLFGIGYISSSVSLIVTIIFFDIIIALIAGRALWRWANVNKEFSQALNPLVYNKALSLLGIKGEHKNAEVIPATDIYRLLDNSELITESRNTQKVDDVVVSEFYGRSLLCAELSIKHVTGSGKSRRVKNIFHGIFISYELPRKLEAKTFITTDNDQSGFGGLYWGQGLFQSNKPKETLLEWNDFNNKLHVATTNETEARYILTTDFMQSLYDWWEGRPGRIRLSFIEQRLSVLYPDSNIQIGLTATSLGREDLEKYLLSVVRPLWHIKKLLESSENRLRN